MRRTTPPAGRPSKNGKGNPPSKIAHFRLSEQTLIKIDECSEKLKLNKTEVVEMGVDLLHNEVEKKEEQ